MAAHPDMMTQAATFTSAELAELDALLATSASAPELVTRIRQTFPGKTVTRCEAADVTAEEPYRRYAQLDLYFVDSREHCWHISPDPMCATGVLLARHAGPP